jgi:gliding motility-associated-like protein
MIRLRFFLRISKFILLFACCISGIHAFSQNYTVPVVFHIIGINPTAITDLQIMNAVQDLNNAFAHTGPYAPGTPAVNTRIQFCLARIDPDGGISTGITRTQSALGDMDQDLEDARLKQLVSWNTNEYCNIWLVDSVKNEYYTRFSCGVWTRYFNKPYASFLPGGDYRDGIVSTGFGPLLAMVMGNYLGLKQTYTYNSCANNDCNTDGDGVCDTPPASIAGVSCAPLQNSCSSDTLSGFATDVPDLTSNFMSFSGACSNSFTAGQAAKMRVTLTNTRIALVTGNKCNPPCNENISVSFTRDNWLPEPGDLIHFTATAIGGTNYQWTVNGTPAGGNSPAFNQTFPIKGKYQIMLKVYNANANCFASYSDSVIVGCGLLARFSPDKRLIAAKDQILNDSIFFNNLSVGAGSYQWWMSNNAGMAPQIVSSGFNLNQVFHAPGQYTVWLIASNGTCSDTSAKFNFTVNDPTIDGTVSFTDVQCYQETKINASIYICNNGYVAIPQGTPVSFYDGDPILGPAKKIGVAFLIPTPVAGNCCGSFNTILDVGKQGLNQLYAVFNDNGNAVPVVLPNNPLPETNYINNIAFIKNFQFKATIEPPAASLQPGDSLQLIGSGTPGTVARYVWTPTPELSCTDCASPLFIAGKNDVTEKLVVSSSYGCTDSATAAIKVSLADDYSIQIDSVECAKNDSVLVLFTVCNLFKRGLVPNGLKITFYDGDPSKYAVHLLPLVYTVASGNPEKCMSFRTYLKGTTSGYVYAAVNDNGGQTPLQWPVDSLFLETDYTNNISSAPYLPGQVLLNPPDTSLFIKQSFPVTILSPIYDPASTIWDTGPGYTLSCTACLSPVVTATADAQVTVHTNNEFGCKLEGKVNIKIFPPDFTAQILETHCFKNDSLLVKFRICANNGYESLFPGIPVSFYDGNGSGTNKLLEPVFYTGNLGTGNCDSFSTRIKAPLSGNLLMLVNDRGQNNAGMPDTAFNETDFTNNSSTSAVVPFSVTIHPSDTTVNRLSPVPLHFEVTGGQMTSFNWTPAEFISCIQCQEPVVTPPHTLIYELEVQNEYACITRASVQINTLAGGKVSIPNAFTPNGDGKNDVFYIMGNQDVKIVKEFSIFNRWGYVVFSENNVPANDPRYGWNGLLKGSMYAPEAYVYVAVIEFKDGTVQVFKGSVVLIQ